MKNINDYGLSNSIKESHAIKIGVSAGAVNMSDHVVIPKDINEIVSYDGVGLVPINVVPHYSDSSVKLDKMLKCAAASAPLYALYDNSFILYTEGSYKCCGKYKLFTAE